MSADGESEFVELSKQEREQLKKLKKQKKKERKRKLEELAAIDQEIAVLSKMTASPSKKRKLNKKVNDIHEAETENIAIKKEKEIIQFDEDLKEAEEPSTSTTKCTGSVVWFYNDRGFGWIKNDDGPDDIFVHATDIYCEGFRSLAHGQQVEFDIEKQNDGRTRAVNVTGPNGAFCIGKENENSERRHKTGDERGRRGCYNCGEDGHRSRECPKREKQRESGRTGVCYKCGEVHHFSRECPKHSDDDRGHRGGDRRREDSRERRYSVDSL